jgi:hypothetical protein
MLAPQPTRINTLFIDGPIYHWDRITDAQALALGVTLLPAPRTRSVAKSGAWTVRRLADGTLNVSCAGARPHTLDRRYRSFMSGVLGAADRFRPSLNDDAPASSDFAPL